MLDRLPVLIDPVKLSERGKTLSGTIKASELARLSELLLTDSTEIDIVLSFDKEGRTPTIQGRIKIDLTLECQACLEPVNWPIDISFKLGLVLSLEQADRLASDCEPLLLESEKISLNQLVEDELLLAIPDFPRHKHDCAPNNNSQPTKEETKQSTPNNPFSVLAKLKNTGD